MIVIDNYDSFTYNIVQYLKILGENPHVYKNDEVTLDELESMNFSSVIISPGPASPDEAGISMDVIKRFYPQKAILGVCLGHQCIAQAFGAKITHAANPMHGKCSEIYFDSAQEIFSGLKQGFSAVRYHSLIVDTNSLTPELQCIAKTKDDVLMALKVKNTKTYGVQFHPEAILTDNGIQILKNFIKLSKDV